MEEWQAKRDTRPSELSAAEGGTTSGRRPMSAQWQVASAGAMGAQHAADGLPYQDAAQTVHVPRPDRTDAVALAVADGHGHARHFRSDRGARYAAAAGCQVGARIAPQLADAADAAAVPSIVEAALVPQVVACWRRAVAA